MTPPLVVAVLLILVWLFVVVVADTEDVFDGDPKVVKIEVWGAGWGEGGVIVVGFFGGAGCKGGKVGGVEQVPPCNIKFGLQEVHLPFWS